MKWKEAKNVYFVSLRSKTKRKTLILFRFEAKQINRKRNKAKRKIFESETKRKYAVLVSLWSEAKFFFFSRECAKHMRNGSRFASFRFEAQNFFLRNFKSYGVFHSSFMVFQCSSCYNKEISFCGREEVRMRKWEWGSGRMKTEGRARGTVG